MPKEYGEELSLRGVVISKVLQLMFQHDPRPRPYNMLRVVLFICFAHFFVFIISHLGSNVFYICPHCDLAQKSHNDTGSCLRAEGNLGCTKYYSGVLVSMMRASYHFGCVVLGVLFPCAVHRSGNGGGGG